MTKTIILVIAVAAVFVAGIFAFMTLNQASAGPPPPLLTSTERDNTTVTGLKTPKTTSTTVGAIVLLDNAGAPSTQTSEVEVTWTKPFTDSDCALVTVGGILSASPGPGPNLFGVILGNDGAFAGTTVAHNDVTGAKAILLVDKTVGDDDDDDDDDGGCSLGSDFVTVSTVGSTP